MDARLDYFASPTAAKVLKHFISAGGALTDSPLPAATQELVALRVTPRAGRGCSRGDAVGTGDGAPGRRR